MLRYRQLDIDYKSIMNISICKECNCVYFHSIVVDFSYNDDDIIVTRNPLGNKINFTNSIIDKEIKFRKINKKRLSNPMNVNEFLEYLKKCELSIQILIGGNDKCLEQKLNKETVNV